MGIFDWFKKKSPEGELRQAVAGIAVDLFPGGYNQVRQGGEHISRIVGGKISPDQASKLFGAVMYLAVYGKDRSPERIRASIVARGGGAISTLEAGEIYKFLLSQTPPSKESKQPSESNLYVDVDQHGVFTLANSQRSITLGAAELAMLIQVAFQAGWKDTGNVFDQIGRPMLPEGEHAALSDADAYSLGSTLQLELNKRGQSISDMSGESAFIRRLIEFCFEGGFEFHLGQRAEGAPAEQLPASKDKNSTSHASIADYARELNVPASVLLAQLAAAGVRKHAAEESISEQDKRRLLEYLRSEQSSNSADRKLQRKHNSTSGDRSRTSRMPQQAMLLQSYLNASMPLVSGYMQNRTAMAGLQVFILGMADMLRQAESLSWDQFIAVYEMALSEYGLLPSTPIEAFVQNVGSVAASSPEVEKVMKYGAQSIRMYISEHDANASADLVSAAVFAERNASSFGKLAP